MTDTQMLAMVAPVTSLVIVVAGYIVQNSNLNARIAELRSEFRELLKAQADVFAAELRAIRAEQKAMADTFAAELRAVRAEQKAMADTFAAELRAVRAEMAKNQSELLTALVQHDHPMIKKP